MEALHRELGEDNYRPCPNLREMVDAGYLGSKTGRRVFQYSRPRHADRAEKPVSMTFRGTKASTSRDAVTHPSLTDRLRALASGSRCRSSASNSRPACEPSPAPPCPPLGDSPAVWPAVPLRRPRGPLTDPERRPVGLLFADFAGQIVEPRAELFHNASAAVGRVVNRQCYPGDLVAEPCSISSMT